jgi:LmbE family N-acetylglucosaminyl deacetylase
LEERTVSDEKEFIPKSAMSIHAHPDDQEFTVAGTLAKWAQAGCEVISVILTSGDGGSNDPAHDASYKPTLARIREDEQSAANELIGIKQTIYMQLPDGELEPTVALRKELTKIIRTYKPEVVVTGDPQGVFYGNGYINHPDHRAAAQLATYAVFPSAGSRLVFADLLAEGFEPHNVKRLYLHGPEKPDTWIDISEGIDTKVAALKKHASQLGDWDPEKMIREWAAEEGKEKELKYAEAYKVMILEQEQPEN